MTILREGDIEIAIPSWASGRRFDDNAVHGLSHCHLKAVDFIIEAPGKTMFVEVKNPPAEGPGADSTPWTERPDERRDLVRKYRDSFLYEWAAGRSGSVVGYYVLVATPGLEGRLLADLSRSLRVLLPVGLPTKPVWTREIARQATAFSIDSWNRYLADFPVTRVGQAAD